MFRRIFLFTYCCVLSACAPKKEPEIYKTALPTREVMLHVISPSAYAFWGAWGEVATLSGTRSLRPTTDEGWAAAENGAATVAEAANLLMLPSRRRDDGDWVKYSQQMHDAAMAALAATEARDSDRMGATGDALYATCSACHEKYQTPAAAAAVTRPGPIGRQP